MERAARAVTMQGPCQLVAGGVCATSGNFPGLYTSGERCTLRGLPPNPLTVDFFEVEDTVPSPRRPTPGRQSPTYRDTAQPQP